MLNLENKYHMFTINDESHFIKDDDNALQTLHKCIENLDIKDSYKMPEFNERINAAFQDTRDDFWCEDNHAIVLAEERDGYVNYIRRECDAAGTLEENLTSMV